MAKKQDAKDKIIIRPFSLFQRLPIEIIDLILKQVGAPSNKWNVHNCQYRKCSSKKYQSHNLDLLNMSQVCQHFRQIALPKLWSKVFVKRNHYKSLNNFLFSTPDRETLYLQHIKYVLLEPVSGSWKATTDYWVIADETQPFGFKTEGLSYPAWFCKQAIYWMTNRNLEHMDVINSSGVGINEIYRFKLLFPFWLCVSNTSTKNCFVDFAKLRNVLKNSGRTNPKVWVWNTLDKLSKKETKDLKEYQNLDQRESDYLSYVAQCLVNEPHLRKQVDILCENDWKLPKNIPDVRPKYNRRSKDGCVHM